MPKGGNGELINHFNAVRLRLVGDGELKLSWFSLNDEIEQELLSLPMVEGTAREPTRISNFKQQRASLRISTTEFDEYFKIYRIVIFIKPIASGFPG